MSMNYHIYKQIFIFTNINNNLIYKHKILYGRLYNISSQSQETLSFWNLFETMSECQHKHTYKYISFPILGKNNIHASIHSICLIITYCSNQYSLFMGYFHRTYIVFVVMRTTLYYFPALMTILNYS